MHGISAALLIRAPPPKKKKRSTMNLIDLGTSCGFMITVSIHIPIILYADGGGGGGEERGVHGGKED